MSNTVKPKTAALTMPSDPLSILSMQNLDRHFAASPSTEPEPEGAILTSINQDDKPASQQDILTDSHQDDNQATQQDVKSDILPPVQQASKTDRKQAGQTSGKAVRKPASALEAASDPAVDPLDRALLQKLARAYPDLVREKATLVSSRLPDDVVERLGYAADLVKKHRKSKQDVITRGLLLAFEELVKSDGAVEWYEK